MKGFPRSSVSKESVCNAGDLGSIPGLGRPPGGEHGNPLQYSGLENPHGQRSLMGYSSWGHKELDMTEQLSIAQHIEMKQKTWVRKQATILGTWGSFPQQSPGIGYRTDLRGIALKPIYLRVNLLGPVSSLLNILRKCQTKIHRGCINLNTH